MLVVTETQVTEETFQDLFARFEALKECGILPEYTWNHGPGTSFYYKDPDGNMMELSAPNFDNENDYLAYFTTDSYRRNITGIKINADEYVVK